MKKQSLGSIAFLVLAVIAAAWLNYEENDTEHSQEAAKPKSGSADYVLAVSWQPAFCEQRPGKPECRSQRAGRFDANYFTLHGLWPQPRDNVYCGVSQNTVKKDKSGRWNELPKLDLSQPLRDELASKMPGYRSNLHRHEWYKHGTCMPGYSPEKYFRVSLDLLDQLNGSAVRELIVRNISREVPFRDFNTAYQRAFGREAAKRVILDCYRDDGRRIIQEFKLSISGNLSKMPDLGSLLAAGDTVGRSCPGGIVDPVGLQ
ncbi:MAG: ribonuclease [Rhizobiaceae bacterium]|nr:ribonuclease [Rhizobiaceae bacterium]